MIAAWQDVAFVIDYGPLSHSPSVSQLLFWMGFFKHLAGDNNMFQSFVLISGR